MNTVAQFLMEKAAELRESTPELVAVELLKQAGLSDQDARVTVAQDAMEKQACFELTYKGIDMEDAVKLVKAANINIKELSGFSLTSEEEELAGALEKAAGYINKQAEYIAQLEADLEKAASEGYEVRIVEVEKPSPSKTIEKIASVGAFTMDDLRALEEMPEELLTKMASAMEQPWEMGKAAGVSRPQTDPLLEFILG